MKTLLRIILEIYYHFRYQAKLDWEAIFDPKSLEYKASYLFDANEPLEKKVWETGPVLDQGREGACVGFAWTAELMAEPMKPIPMPSEDVANRYAKGVYRQAQTLDIWPGEDYSGTSVLAGAKVLKDRGYLESFHWCFSVDELKYAVTQLGPVVLGVNWYRGMYRTQTIDGKAFVDVSGKKVGGHAITVVGYDPEVEVNGVKTECFIWRNSWGSGYGDNGNAYITVEALEELAKDRTEFCVPIARKRAVI